MKRYDVSGNRQPLNLTNYKTSPLTPPTTVPDFHTTVFLVTSSTSAMDFEELICLLQFTLCPFATSRPNHLSHKIKIDNTHTAKINQRAQKVIVTERERTDE